MRTTIEQLFTQISPSYDILNHLLSLGQDLAWRRRSVELLPWPKAIPLRALDLCAGTLDFGLALSTHYKNAEIHSLDFSLAMLRQGEKKIPRRLNGHYPRYCADACKLPFKDTSFDLVLCAYGMRNIADNTHCLLEIKRVLKPKGYIGILEFFSPSSFSTKFFYKTFGATMIPALGGLVSGQKAAYTYLTHSIQGYYPLSAYLQLLERSGIKIYKIKNFILKISSFILGIKA